MKFNVRVLLGAIGILAAVAIGAYGQIGTTAASDEQQPEAVVDAQGNPRVPTDYRTSYQFLGSWAIAADEDQGSRQLHLVYASPGAVAAFRKDGHFPDGTVLVKEVYDTATESMTTGTVSHAQTLAGWFVMVRDSRNTHAGNKLWGSGWGWSWFDAANPSKTASTDYETDCQSCHIPAKSTDRI